MFSSICVLFFVGETCSFIGFPIFPANAPRIREMTSEALESPEVRGKPITQTVEVCCINIGDGHQPNSV